MDPSDRPGRTRDVRRYLAKHGIRDVCLLKGPGYFYFDGKPTEDWVHHTVDVSFLGDLTFDEWLRTDRAMDENPANRKSIRARNR